MTYEVVTPDDVYDADDGQRVVLLDQEVMVISPLAAEFLDAVESGSVELAAITERLVLVFGNPAGVADPELLVGQVAEDLIARGLLRHVSAS